jgi:hypothetical protein
VVRGRCLAPVAGHLPLTLGLRRGQAPNPLPVVKNDGERESAAEDDGSGGFKVRHYPPASSFALGVKVRYNAGAAPLPRPPAAAPGGAGARDTETRHEMRSSSAE